MAEIKYCKDIVATWKPRLQRLPISQKEFIKRTNPTTSHNYFSRIVNGKKNITIEFADKIEESMRKHEKLFDMPTR